MFYTLLESYLDAESNKKKSKGHLLVDLFRKSIVYSEFFLKK